LLSLKQNLMQVLCSLTPAISINTCTYKEASCQTVGQKIQKRGT
jgi:hypothetical protein